MIFFQLTRFSLHGKTNHLLALIKTTVDVFAISITTFIDWLIFEGNKI